jgi:catalase
MIAHLRNVDDDLARSVASGLGLTTLPDPLPAAMPTNRKLPPSPALSIARNPAGTFSGRKLGMLVADGAPATIVNALAQAVRKAGGVVQTIAASVAGVTADDGTRIAADGQLAGSPSVVFDAVALVAGDGGAPELAALPATRDFIADAFAHCKYIGYTSGAEGLIATALGDAELDAAVIEMDSAAAAKRFCDELGNLRAWDREKPNDTSGGVPKAARAAKAQPAPRKGAAKRPR